MSIMIGHASIDEHGKIAGGASGDQNGKEVCTRSYYMSSKGWYLLRPKSTKHANAIAKAMLRACKNDNIGYDQNNRLGVIKNGTSSKVKTEADCSSLVRQCVIEGTGKDPGNFTTSDEAKKLEATGLFEKKVAVKSSTVLHDGDVLVTKTKGHTVIVVSGNPRGQLEVDGVWGVATTKRLQQIFGTNVDGEVSNQLMQYKDENPGLSATTFEWLKQPNGKGSALIKAMQKWAGMSILKRDGEIGTETIKALQKKLGTPIDGCVSNPSTMVKALQKWANQQ